MKDVIQKLWRFGHFNNPNYDCRDLVESDVKLLTYRDKYTIQALKSWQDFFHDDIDSLCKKHHKRGLMVDGNLGPATLELLNKPRCAHPDYEAIREHASWGKPCRHKITTSYKFDGLNLDQDTIRTSWALALGSWENVIDVLFQLSNTFSRKSRIWATDGRLPGSTLAWSYLISGGCGSSLEQRYDTLVKWSLKFLQAVICHEVGHALGSSHLRTRSSVMYPSVSNIIIPQQSDIDNMIRLGYKPTKKQPVPKLPGYGTESYL